MRKYNKVLIFVFSFFLFLSLASCSDANGGKEIDSAVSFEKLYKLAEDTKGMSKNYKASAKVIDVDTNSELVGALGTNLVSYLGTDKKYVLKNCDTNSIISQGIVTGVITTRKYFEGFNGVFAYGGLPIVIFATSNLSTSNVFYADCYGNILTSEAVDSTMTLTDVEISSDDKFTYFTIKKSNSNISFKYKTTSGKFEVELDSSDKTEDRGNNLYVPHYDSNGSVSAYLYKEDNLLFVYSSSYIYRTNLDLESLGFVDYDCSLTLEMSFISLKMRFIMKMYQRLEVSQHINLNILKLI